MAALDLRALSTGEILDGSLALLRRYFGLFFGVAIVCQGLPTALDAYVGLTGGGERHVALAFLTPVLDFVGSLLVSGATVRAVSEAYLGREPRLGDALSFALRNVGPVFGAGFAAGFVTLLASLAFVIPGVIVFCGYSVVVQAAVLEALPSSAHALRRSWQLTRGFKGKALGLWAVAIALMLVLFSGVAMLSGTAASLVGALETPAYVAMSLLSLVTYPLIGCIFTLFYYDLRVRKEGFDLEMLSQSLVA